MWQTRLRLLLLLASVGLSAAVYPTDQHITIQWIGGNYTTTFFVGATFISDQIYNKTLTAPLVLQHNRGCDYIDPLVNGSIVFYDREGSCLLFRSPGKFSSTSNNQYFFFVNCGTFTLFHK